VSAKNRRPARKLALQALYELDSTTHAVADVMTERLEESPLPDEQRQFAYKLVNGVLEYKDRLNVVIHEYAPEWPLNQMAIIDRNILRIAIYEFAILEQTPIKVAINEAIELAKDFGSESTSRFINGVLGTLAAKEDELRIELAKGVHP
jgi:N utilization substance protein B